MSLWAEFSREVLDSAVWIRSSFLLFFLAMIALPVITVAGEGPAPARIIVAFQKTASPDEIQALERRYELKMVSDLPAANSRVYLLLGPKNLPETVKAISAEPIARYAEVDQKVSIN